MTKAKLQMQHLIKNFAAHLPLSRPQHETSPRQWGPPHPTSSPGLRTPPELPPLGPALYQDYDQRALHYNDLLAAEAKAIKGGLGLHSKRKELPLRSVL